MFLFRQFICIPLLACVSCIGSPKALLKGVITDSEGAAIRKAHIFVHWDQSGAHVGLESNVGVKQDLTLETDEKGQFTVDLSPGFYDVFVSATAFSPDCRKILVKPGETAIYNAKLNMDPVVAKEIGDKF